MPISPDVMRVLLVISWLGMLTLGFAFLRTRTLTSEQTWKLALTILLLPYWGAFWVILRAPGTPRPPNLHAHPET
jgi:hypothetical protein